MYYRLCESFLRDIVPESRFTTCLQCLYAPVTAAQQVQATRAPEANRCRRLGPDEAERSLQAHSVLCQAPGWF